MSSVFQGRKEKILAQLSVSDQDYTDLSPKGSVDEGIRKLVDAVNDLDGFVTTSSCAGRIAVFAEGAHKANADAIEGDASAGIGGKGGGKWLFVSHDPVDLAAIPIGKGNVLSFLGMQEESKEDSVRDLQPKARPPRYVHLKFEPMILHILTSSLPNAQQALLAGMTAGFRESGISGVTGHDPTPLVAIRSGGLAFDCIVGQLDEHGNAFSMVTEAYLHNLICVGNERFAANAERKERFAAALLHSVRRSTHNDTSAPDWEPSDVRKERKRAEGLKRKEELRKDSRRSDPSTNETSEDANEGIEDNLCLDVLST